MLSSQGSVAQFAVLAGVWFQYSPLGECVSARTAAACWDEPFSRQVCITLVMCSALWLYSLRTIPYSGSSDPSIVDRAW